VQFHILLVADVTPLQHVQNERYRMMHSPVTRVQKWRNRNLVIFPPFSTPQGGERGANQNDPLTANSSQVPVECVGILGGGRPLHCFGNTVRRKFKKNFSSVHGPRSAVSVCARQSPYGRSKCACYTAWDRNARNVPHPLSGVSRFRPNIAERCRPWLRVAN
jgi:hypothetical protein